jgi:hypothetical protein
MRPRILVISLSELALDGRVRRQLQFLSSDFEVVVAAVSSPLTMPGVQFAALEPSIGPSYPRRFESLARVGLRLARRYERAYWLDSRIRHWARTLKSVGEVDAILVNDPWALPVALAVAGKTPVIFDSHEHWTSESASWTWWQHVSMRKAHEWIVDRLIPRTAGIMTVSPGIVDAYQRRIGVRPALVTNAPFYEPLNPTPVHSPIRLVHVGCADERRRLEDTIDVVRSLGERFTLDMFLLRENPYRRRLERMVARDERIRILPPVPREDLIKVSNEYDVGVFLLPSKYPNQIHSLPNKLFDYIQARLAVAIGPSPQMAAVVHKWECGVVSESFSPTAFAALLDSLSTSEIERMKSNAHRAASVLTADENRATFLGVITDAISSRAVPSGRDL